jgi:hypothetical protein
MAAKRELSLFRVCIKSQEDNMVVCRCVPFSGVGGEDEASKEERSQKTGTCSPRILNPTEKGAEARSSQAPTADPRRFYFTAPAVPFGLYIRQIPRPCQHLLMHLQSQATVDIHHAALSSLPRPLQGHCPARSITEQMRKSPQEPIGKGVLPWLREPTQLTAPVKRAS